MADWLGSVFRGVFDREVLGLKKDVSGGIKDALGMATGGVLGNRNIRQPQDYDPSRPQPRPEIGSRSAREIGGQQRPGLLETLSDAPNRLLRAVVPQAGGATDRTLRGLGVDAGLGQKVVLPTIAAALDRGTKQLDVDRMSTMIGNGAMQKPTTETLDKYIKRGQLSVDDARKMVENGHATVSPAQKPAPVVDRSTYSAAAIAEAQAEGRDTSKMKVAKPDTPAAGSAVAAGAASPASGGVQQNQVGLAEQVSAGINALGRFLGVTENGADKGGNKGQSPERGVGRQGAAPMDGDYPAARRASPQVSADSPAIETNISAGTAFAAVASQTPVVAEPAGRFDQGTYDKAREFVAANKIGGGPGVA